MTVCTLTHPGVSVISQKRSHDFLFALRIPLLYCVSFVLYVYQSWLIFWVCWIAFVPRIWDTPGYWSLVALSKMEHFGIWISASYLADMSQYIGFNASNSDRLPCHSGVPHGSVQGILLFIFVRQWSSCCSENLSCLLFANDTIVISNGDRHIIWDVPFEGRNWFTVNRLKLDHKKNLNCVYFRQTWPTFEDRGCLLKGCYRYLHWDNCSINHR